MVQLFEIFCEQYIRRLVQLKKIYLVTQTYSSRGVEYMEGEKRQLLLTDYEDLGLATVHRSAVKQDRYAAIIDLSNDKHLCKLREMLREGSPYVLWWSVVKDRERFRKRLELKYKDNIRRYLLEHTKWQIAANESITANVQMIFGELFMILKRGGQELRVKFAEIEKS